MSILNPWSFTYIRKLVDEATYFAKFFDLRPTLVDEAIKNYKTSNRFNIPFLGDYVPAGWERADQVQPMFVDTTGTKRREGNTLTQHEFYKLLLQRQIPSDIGFAVIERGQTSALVAAYRKVLIPLSDIEPT